MRALLLSLALLLPPAAHAQDNPIVTRIAALVDAYNAGDLAGIGAVYHPEAALFPPGEPAILGRDAIVQHYADAIAGGASNVQFQVFDIRPSDIMAVATGEVVLDVNGSRIVTRFMHVWEVDGNQLFLTRDMYHVLAVQ